ncbi:MAG: Hsp20/alpha crystallin family protein [Burkholderiales bacterium]|nr:Hsp20/alpha crystallin family protein [Burkholderiales bacterium]
MNTLVRFDPAADRLDDFFAGFFRPVLSPDRATVGNTSEIRIDVREDEKSYAVDAAIPGVKKEDIHVAIDGNEVSITAEVKNEKEVKEGERVLRTERFYGKTTRRFALAQEIDESGAAAKYEDGVLKLTLPKKAVTTARKLTIQ